MWGHRLNKSLGMGYVTCEDGVNKDFLNNGDFEIKIAWQRYKAKVQIAPFYDPKSSNIKA